MNRTVPLSQFMPYGAPDLQAAGPAHLSRAVIASSALAVAAFFVAVIVTPYLARVAPLVVPIPPAPHVLSELDRTLEPPPQAPPTVPVAPPKGQPDKGVIEPVVDPPELPPIVEPPPVGTTGGDPNVKTVQVFPPAPPGPPEPPETKRFYYADELPVPIREVKPEYPRIAQEAGVEGTVVVHVYLGKDGRVLKAELDEKARVPLLDDAALEAAKRWVFKPAFTNNQPVSVWVVLPFRFILHTR